MRFTVQPLDGGEPVVLHDSTNAHQVGMWLAQEGVEGWFGTPAIREEPTERAMTDGDMSPATLTQGARTITLHGIAAAPSTVEAARLMDLVNGLAGRELAVIGEDAHGAREVRGFLSDDPLPQLLHGEDAFTFDVTVTCPDPHKYGMEVAYPASGETVAVTNVGNCATWPRVHVEGHVESLVLSLAGRLRHHNRVTAVFAKACLQFFAHMSSPYSRRRSCRNLCASPLSLQHSDISPASFAFIYPVLFL